MNVPIAEDYIELNCPHCGKLVDPELVNSAWHTAIILAGHARKAQKLTTEQAARQAAELREAILQLGALKSSLATIERVITAAQPATASEDV